MAVVIVEVVLRISEVRRQRNVSVAVGNRPSHVSALDCFGAQVRVYNFSELSATLDLVDIRILLLVVTGKLDVLAIKLGVEVLTILVLALGVPVRRSGDDLPLHLACLADVILVLPPSLEESP